MGNQDTTASSSNSSQHQVHGEEGNSGTSAKDDSKEASFFLQLSEGVSSLPEADTFWIKEIRQRDPSFSLPAEIQDVVKPVLNAYIKGDVETLSKSYSPEVIERCKAEHNAYQSHGIFFDNKILHVSYAEVRETKMMGTSIIILAFQTQQVHCVRNRNGPITEGGKDTIHTVYYAWAMQQLDLEDLGEGAIYPYGG